MAAVFSIFYCVCHEILHQTDEQGNVSVYQDIMGSFALNPNIPRGYCPLFLTYVLHESGQVQFLPVDPARSLLQPGIGQEFSDQL